MSLAVPAHADDATSTATTAPPDTTVTTVPDTPAAYDDTTTTTIDPTATTDTTDTTVAPTPTTDTTATTEPPPDTTTTTAAPPDTTPTSAPAGVPVVLPNDPPSGGGGASSGGTGGGSTGSATANASATAKNSPRVQTLMVAATQDALASSVSAKNPIDAVQAALRVPASVQNSLKAAARAGGDLSARLENAFDPRPADGSWGLGSAAPRFGPWIVLLVVAWLVRMVAASVLADRTAGPRRRRWTLL